MQINRPLCWSGKNSHVQNHVNVTINDVPVEQVNSMKYFGIHLDDNLSWDVQCDKPCRNIAGKISVLRRIRSFIQPEALKSFYEKTVQPVFDYTCTVWSNIKQGDIQILQITQNYAARMGREILIMGILGVWISYMALNALPFKRGMIISLHCSCTNQSMD